MTKKTNIPKRNTHEVSNNSEKRLSVCLTLWCVIQVRAVYLMLKPSQATYPQILSALSGLVHMILLHSLLHQFDLLVGHFTKHQLLWQSSRWYRCYQLTRQTHIMIRDATKFEFDKVRTLNIFNRFEIRRMFLTALLLNANSWKNPCSPPDLMWYAQTDEERRQTFFTNSTYHTNYNWMCNIIFTQ